MGLVHGAVSTRSASAARPCSGAISDPWPPGAEHLPPLGLAARFFGPDRPFERFADYIDYALSVQGDVAALIAEPTRWTTVEPPPPGFWPRVAKSCARNGALLIFDEIPCCLARTGHMFACEGTGATPDILVIGKGLGGGVMPMAAIIADGKLDRAGETSLGHYTHEKSPLGSAAALATLDVIAEERLVERARALSERGLGHLRTLARKHPAIAEVRALGCYFGAQIGGPDAARLAERALYACLARGLSYKIGGGDVLTLCPPLTIPEAEFDRAFAILDDALAEIGA